MTSERDESTGTAGQGPYRVLARKYRPQSFADLIGQEPMVRTLTNAFDAGRIAQAWMLTGVRGVGKTTTARILARALNYETETVDRPTIHMEAEGVHDRAIMEGRHVDVVEMDAASHTGIDDIREIIAQVRYRPVSARYKVYIIDEVHMLSTQAFNGLLKTLEEPPEHVKFVFATTEIRKVPITVLSRCQRFDLRRVPSAEMMAHLSKVLDAESVEVEEEALRILARASEGSVRDALSLTDQAIAHGAGLVTAGEVRDMLGLADRVRVIDLFETLMRGNASAAIAELREQYASGADPVVVLTDLADFTHLVTSLRFVPESGDDASLSPAEAERGRRFATELSVRTLSQVWQMLLKAIEEARLAASPRQAAEMALIRIAHAADLPDPEDLMRMLAGGEAPALPAAAPSASATPVPSLPAAPRGAAASAPSSLVSSSPPSAPAPASSAGSAPSTSYPSLPQGGGPTASLSRLGSGGGPNLALMMRAAPPSVAPRVEAQQVEESDLPTSLAGLEALANEKRDSLMRARIRRYLRLASIEPGRIEAALADGAPATFANDLSRKLHDWTGRRYVVSLVSQGGGETLEERDARRRAERIADAASHPDIAAILAAVPGAEIREVRMRGESDEPDEPVMPEPPALADEVDLPERFDMAEDDEAPFGQAGEEEPADEIFDPIDPTDDEDDDR
ncbi:DNA polymerase III subunit gamma/tau [Aureimonas mangrovi]|uniref:DNA polymerase III subunit gamma/tau n=1 Tax=Aureimonas mangrovi TaxID=2758041 RepID=UPI00163DA5FD|nr:DNA polymerase III subunit gamma/tau [Aureimonas mangrovi]